MCVGSDLVSAQEEGKEQWWPQDVNKPLIERLEPRPRFLLCALCGRRRMD
jgi:hypothetical protein